MGLRLLQFVKKTGDCESKFPNKLTHSTPLPIASPPSARASQHLDVFRRLELVSPGHADVVRDLAARLLQKCQQNRAAGFTDDDVND